MSQRRAFGIGLALSCAMAPGFAAAPSRVLTIEERVEAQRKIERVYHSHLVGTRPPFEEIASTERLERRVRTYVAQSVALEQIWNAPLTAEALVREWQRITRSTSFPDRLRELYHALGDDPFVIQECLVRAELVDHLARGRFAYDPSIHAAARAEAEALRDSLVRGALDPRLDHPRRAASAVDSKRSARPGEIGPVEETRDGFEVRVPTATYVVPKTTWDDWWSRTEPSLEMKRFRATALEEWPPLLVDAASAGGPECVPDTWIAGGLDDQPSAKTGHLAFWTGNLMLVYGSDSGGAIRTETHPGSRYDPLIDRWTSMSSTGAPTSTLPRYFGVWTGSEMLVTEGSTGNAGRYDPVSDTWSPMASGGQFGHGASAVWTGSEMIVWGGGSGTFGGPPYTSTGKRYNPSTNTWTAMTTTGAPLARGFPTAVWTGSEMIVWGGIIVSNNTFTNTGGRYNPALDQWTATNTFVAPSARIGHVAVWTNGEMIVHGGVEIYSGNAVQTGARYNPSSDSWTPTANTGAPTRAFHTAVWTGSNMLLWGGNLAQFGGSQNTGASYDPTSGWSILSSTGAPSARSRHSALWTGTRMLVWGGEVSGVAYTREHTGGQYLASTNSWLPITTVAPRSQHTAVWTGNEMIVWGGLVSLTGPLTNTGARYDPTLATWRETSTVGAPAARQIHYAVWTGTKMIVWGGVAGLPNALASGGRYDPLTDTWSGMSVPGFSGIGGSFLAVVWTGTEMIAWGGTAAYGGRYDPVQDTWTQTAPFPGEPRGRTQAAWTGSEMIVWGGWHDNPSTYFGDGGRYNPTSNSWVYVGVGPNSPTPRVDHSAVWTGQSFLVFGGQGPPPGQDVGGRYDPQTSTWSVMSTLNEPTPAYRHTTIWTGGRMIVWGGQIPIAGGLYDPISNSWSVMSTAGAPPRRSYHTAIWSGRSMLVWGGAWSGEFPDNVGAEYFPDSDADSVSDACDNCALVANAGQADQDGDGFGDACDACPTTANVDLDDDGASNCTDCDDSNPQVFPGAPPLCDGVNNDCNNPGWPSVTGTPDADADADTWLVCEGDCNDGAGVAHPGALEICDGIDDDCDALIDEDELGVDTDSDNVRNACDNCRTVSNPSQSDGDGDRVGNACDNCVSNRNPHQTDDDHDGQGDLCDLNDGLIYIVFHSRNLVEWQQESGFTTWNSYRGSLAVLRSSGVYTQAPGSNPLAQRDCGLASPSDAEAVAPGVGEVAFWLVTGKNGGVESSLGTNSVGVPRANTNPCP